MVIFLKLVAALPSVFSVCFVLILLLISLAVYALELIRFITYTLIFVSFFPFLFVISFVISLCYELVSVIYVISPIAALMFPMVPFHSFSLVVQVTRPFLVSFSLTFLYLFGNASELLISTKVFPLMVAGILLYYFIFPETTPTSTLEVKKIQRANWKQVNWEQEISKLKTGKRYAVLGCSFLGKRLVHSLLLRGESEIRIIDSDPKAAETFNKNSAAYFLPGGIDSLVQLKEALKGVEIVYSTITGFDSNFAQNLVAACSEVGVKMLIQISMTPLSYGPDKYIDEKPGEQVILRENNKNGLRTGIIRTGRFVFGSDDEYLLSSMIKLGRAPLPTTNRTAVYDFVYVLNVVWACFLLEKALNESFISMNEFCISNQEPIPFADFVGIANIMRPGGVIRFPIPDKILRLLTHMLDFFAFIGIDFPERLGRMTTTVLKYMDDNANISERTYQDELGYFPIFTVEEGISMSIDEWIQGEALPSLHI